MKKILPVLSAFCVFLLCLAACGLDTTSSLKDLTDPYIARYECTQATLGGDDLLENFDYIRITLLDEKEMELSFKQKGEKPRAKTFKYSYDKESGELYAEEGVLGFKAKEPAVIKDGAFTISFPLGSRQLILKFEE